MSDTDIDKFEVNADENRSKSQLLINASLDNYSVDID